MSFNNLGRVGTGVAFAQPDRDEPKRSEKVAALKRAFITSELALTPVEAEKFWPVYNAHEETQKTHRKELKKVMRSKQVASSVFLSLQLK